MQKTLSIGAVVLVVVGLALYGYFGYRSTNSEQVAMQEETVAKVNGVSITKTAYDEQLASALIAYKTQGVNVDDPQNLSQIRTQVLNDIINNELVMQELSKEGVSVTAEEVESQYQAIKTQSGSEENFKSQLTTANLTEEKLRQNIERQLKVQKYLLKHIDISTITVSDEEITKFYNENIKTQEKPPALKDVKEQIRQQLLTNKQQVLVNSHVDSLKAKAQIETSQV
jgi:hypothetical protein